MAISITPSGAWMPSVIAGDTGIPLTERAQSFLLVPGHPNELAPRQAPARDAQPHAGESGRATTLIALSTPGGDNQDQSLLQVLFYAIDVRHERRERRGSAALPDRAPGLQLRQSRHEPGQPAAGRAHPRRGVVEELSGAAAPGGDALALRQRRRAGDDPADPDGLIEAGADPYYFRSAQAW